MVGEGGATEQCLYVQSTHCVSRLPRVLGHVQCLGTSVHISKLWVGGWTERQSLCMKPKVPYLQAYVPVC